MKMEQEKLKNYFLQTLSPEDSEEIELQVISDEEFAGKLEVAETNLIENYLEKTLSTDETELFEKNFLVTRERKERVEFLKTLKEFSQNEARETEVEEKPPSFFESLNSLFNSRRFALSVGALALVLTVGFLSYFIWKNSSGQSEILLSLNKAYKTERPTEARITDFDYAPKSEGTRGNQKNESLELVSAKSRAAEAVLKNESAENLHELGRVYLAENNFDEAIKQFEKAIKLNPNIAKIHNDLGVAYLEKGKLLPEGGLEFFAKANEEIEKAISLDQNLTEAYFNRGLVVEALKLPNQAREAWQNYLQRDSTSPWADEARKHLQTLEKTQPVGKTKEEILQEFLHAKQANDREKAWQILSKNREMITGKLIPQQLAFLFVDSKTNGDEIKAEETLDALVFAGNLEVEKSGDIFWRDLADYYKNVSTDKISVLKKAQNSIRSGYEHCLKSDFEAGSHVFNEASKNFSEVSNEAELNISRHLMAYCLTQSDKVRESLALRREIDKFGNFKNYKWLQATNSYRKGNDWLVLRQFSKAEKEFFLSAKLSEQIADDYALQRNLLEIADLNSYFGQVSTALKNLEKVLTLSKESEISPRQNWRNTMTAVTIFSNAGFHNTAQLFSREIVKIADEMNDPIFMTGARLYSGQSFLKTGNYAEAKFQLEESAKMAEKILDDELRKNRIAAAFLYTGNLERATGNFQTASEFYQKAVDIYENKQWSFELYEIQKGLLLANKAVNNETEIERQIPILIEFANSNRQAILDEQQRNSFFDIEQDIYDIAIDYEFGKSRFENAFDYSESSRARSLFDLQNSGAEISDNGNNREIDFLPETVKPQKFREIQASLPENVQILEYSVLNDKIVVWLITRENLTAKEIKVAASDLRMKIGEYVELIVKKGDLNEQQKMSAELFEILIKPFAESLDKSKEIVIIPDKFLFNLPFATLFSGKYLIEDYKISFAPSANVFMFCSKRAESLSKKVDENVLSVGNPLFERLFFEGLQTLPSAKTEAEKIAEFYSQSSVITEKLATKTTVRENLDKNDVIHFAGHYLVDEKSTLLSGLVVAGNNAEDSILTNYEIIGEKLSRPRLVILSACQTGIEKYYNGEGMLGASRAFLASGIPLIIASRWEVDSEATANLMINFHRLRKKEKLSTVEALRKAQLELLQTEKYRHPYFWAAFFKLGGYAEF